MLGLPLSKLPPADLTPEKLLRQSLLFSPSFVEYSSPWFTLVFTLSLTSLGYLGLAPKPLVKFSLRLLSNSEVAAPPQPLKPGIAWLARRYRLLLQIISVAASQLSH